MKPNYSFREVPVCMERQVLHVWNDETLRKLIKEDRRNIRALARALRSEHESRFGEELRITENSLTCELAVHYRVYRFVKNLPKALQEKGPICRRALRATAVIDCGEKKEDTNRFVWDILAPLWSLHR